MATSYFVKVYYTKQSQQQPEIRRFAIDIAPESDSYRELCNKVATYQPDIQVHGFLLQYVDEENERITFSSNDELRTAIGMNRDATPLKIFVVANSPKKTTSNDRQGTECHDGVTCDGCQGPVVGARYKCLVCNNYDLCEQCSSAGIHSEHNLMKISKPGNDASHPYGFGRHGRRHHRQRHGHPFIPPTFRPSAEMIERIQSQIPQWLPNRENVQTQIGNLKSTAETHVQNSKQYLETVGQYLQQTLSPFGINCDYRVEGEAAPAASSSSSSSSPSSSSETESMNPEPSAVPKSPRPAESNDGIKSWLNMTPLSNNGTVPTAPPAATSVTPATSIRTPMEKSVDDCIVLMKSMGFDENDHHLIDLIRSKNGDVNQVLDAINGKHNGQ